MSIQESRVLVIVALAVTLLVAGCRQKSQKVNRVQVDSLETQVIRQRCVEKTISVIGIKSYHDILSQLNDTVKSWIKNDLQLFSGCDSTSLRIDTVLCVNSTADKFITCFLRRSLTKGFNNDGIVYYYGVKIQSKWYFVGGPSLALIRKYYKDDINTPILFPKLEQLAAHYKYRYYLKDDGQGGLVINDDFFSDITSQAYCGNCLTQQQWDSAYIRSTRLKWLPNKR